jgi:hypothetical protein
MRVCPAHTTGDFDFMDEWYPIQVKQKDKWVGLTLTLSKR